jgi:hypothetical protein
MQLFSSGSTYLRKDKQYMQKVCTMWRISSNAESYVSSVSFEAVNVRAACLPRVRPLSSTSLHTTATATAISCCTASSSCSSSSSSNSSYSITSTCSTITSTTSNMQYSVHTAAPLPQRCCQLCIRCDCISRPVIHKFCGTVYSSVRVQAQQAFTSMLTTL